MKPEDRARQEIDRQLVACGWIVQDRQSLNIHAGSGVAVREFPVVRPDGKRGSVDYLLYAGAKAIGVVEAKPADHSLGGVEGQARDYAYGLDPDVPHHRLPLPASPMRRGDVRQAGGNLVQDERLNHCLEVVTSVGASEAVAHVHFGVGRRYTTSRSTN